MYLAALRVRLLVKEGISIIHKSIENLVDVGVAIFGSNTVKFYEYLPNHTQQHTKCVMSYDRVVSHVRRGPGAKRKRKRARAFLRCFCIHTLQHTTLHCNTIQYIATHCNTLRDARKEGSGDVQK